MLSAHEQQPISSEISEIVASATEFAESSFKMLGEENITYLTSDDFDPWHILGDLGAQEDWVVSHLKAALDREEKSGKLPHTTSMTILDAHEAALRARDPLSVISHCSQVCASPGIETLSLRPARAALTAECEQNLRPFIEVFQKTLTARLSPPPAPVPVGEEGSPDEYSFDTLFEPDQSYGPSYNTHRFFAPTVASREEMRAFDPAVQQLLYSNQKLE